MRKIIAKHMVFIFKKIDEWCVSKKTDTLIEEVTKSFLISVLIRNISVLFPKNTQEKALIQLLCVLHNMQNIVVLYRDVCTKKQNFTCSKKAS